MRVLELALARFVVFEHRAQGVAELREWLADPQRYKPGSLMPRVPLSGADLDAVAAYLAALR